MSNCKHIHFNLYFFIIILIQERNNLRSLPDANIMERKLIKISEYGSVYNTVYNTPMHPPFAVAITCTPKKALISRLLLFFSPPLPIPLISRSQNIRYYFTYDRTIPFASHNFWIASSRKQSACRLLLCTKNVFHSFSFCFSVRNISFFQTQNSHNSSDRRILIFLLLIHRHPLSYKVVFNVFAVDREYLQLFSFVWIL